MRQHAYPRNGWPHRRRAIALDVLRALAALVAAVVIAATVWFYAAVLIVMATPEAGR